MIHWIVFLSTLAVNGVTAVLGRTPERVAATVFVCAQLATMALALLGVEHLPSSVSWEVVVVDAAVLVCLLVLALRTDRTWVLYATAMAALCLASWLAMAFDLRISYTVGLFVVSFWSTCSMFVALIGAAAVRRTVWAYCAAALQCGAGLYSLAWLSGVTTLGPDDMIVLAACEAGTLICLGYGALASWRDRKLDSHEPAPASFPDR